MAKRGPFKACGVSGGGAQPKLCLSNKKQTPTQLTASESTWTRADQRTLIFVLEVSIQSQKDVHCLLSNISASLESFLVTLRLSTECCKHLPATHVLGIVALHALY